MYTSVNGTYENGVLVLEETPPTEKKSKVLITFLEEVETEKKTGRRVPGSLKRLGLLRGETYSIPDDFNAPLDDLKDYM